MYAGATCRALRVRRAASIRFQTRALLLERGHEVATEIAKVARVAAGALDRPVVVIHEFDCASRGRLWSATKARKTRARPPRALARALAPTSPATRSMSCDIELS